MWHYCRFILKKEKEKKKIGIAKYSVICTKLPILIYHKWDTETEDNEKSKNELLFEDEEEVYNGGLGGTETSITPSSICVTFFIEGLSEGSP